MRIKSFSLTGAALGAFLGTVPAVALTLDQIAAYDLNGNLRIEKGEEATNLLADPNLTTEQKTLVFFGVKEKPDGVSLVSFVDALPPECSVNRRLQLRSGLTDFSLVSPALDTNALNGASLSLTNDATTGLGSWSVKGALYWTLGDPCAGQVEKREGVYVNRYGFAPFVEFDGSKVAGVVQYSRLRAGVLTEIQLTNGRLFPNQIIRIAPYFMTDFQGDANIYGLNASWTPYRLGALLNGRVGDGFWWQFEAVADVRHVQDGGVTGFASGNNSGWVGVNVGTSYSLKPAGTNGFYAKLQLSAFRDVINSDSAEQMAATLGIFLDPLEKSSLELVHRRGTGVGALVKERLTTISLALKF